MLWKLILVQEFRALAADSSGSWWRSCLVISNCWRTIVTFWEVDFVQRNLFSSLAWLRTMKVVDLSFIVFLFLRIHIGLSHELLRLGILDIGIVLLRVLKIFSSAHILQVFVSIPRIRLLSDLAEFRALNRLLQLPLLFRHHITIYWRLPEHCWLPASWSRGCCIYWLRTLKRLLIFLSNLSYNVPISREFSFLAGFLPRSDVWG